MRRKQASRVMVIIPTLWKKDSTLLEHALTSVLADAQVQQHLTIHITVFLNEATLADQRYLSRRLRACLKIERGQLSVLSSERNKGFTGAVNEALFWARVEQPNEWYVVLNDDAVLKPGFFHAFMAAARKSDVELISCGVENTEHELESYGLSYHRTGLAFPRKELSSPVTAPIACGTCFAFSNRLVEWELTALGFLLNPLFFAYAEDLELSLRVLLRGKRVELIPAVLVQHQGSQTAGRASAFQLYHGYRNLSLCIALLWTPQQIAFHLPWIFLGQLYVIVILLSKSYLLVYPRIVWYFIKQAYVLKAQRSMYAQHYGYLYSAQH